MALMALGYHGTHLIPPCLVPGPPRSIKVVVDSEQGAVVAWLAPAQPSGEIIQYSVYVRYSTVQYSTVQYSVSQETTSIVLPTIHLLRAQHLNMLQLSSVITDNNKQYLSPHCS